jgi:hypothetical protein
MVIIYMMIIMFNNRGGTATFSHAPAGDEGAKIVNEQEITAHHIQTVDITVTTFDDYVTKHKYISNSRPLRCHQ